jgi:hypothetical protein
MLIASMLMQLSATIARVVTRIAKFLWPSVFAFTGADGRRQNSGNTRIFREMNGMN